MRGVWRKKRKGKEETNKEAEWEGEVEERRREMRSTEVKSGSSSQAHFPRNNFQTQNYVYNYLAHITSLFSD